MKALFVGDMYILFNADRLSINPYYGPMKMSHGFAGSILMDLMLNERIQIIGNKLTVVNTTPIGDSFLDGALSLLVKSKPSKKIKYYISYLLESGAYLYRLISDRLIKLDYMKMSITIKGFIPQITVDFFDKGIRENIVNTVKKILINDSPVPDKHFWYFLSLLRATRSFKDILGKNHKKEVKTRLKKLVADEPIGKQVKRAIREAETAETAP
ncbi:MAG: GPP34 family phosphoprotein [Promethearchaeota archaeon]